MELITWRGTPGVGDFMWALNCAHHHANKWKTKVNLEFQWEHDEDHLHHFEDPETIIERLHYIHNFYHKQDEVTVSHVFNATGRYSDWKYSDDLILNEEGRLRNVTNKRNKNKNRFWFESGKWSDTPGSPIPENHWIFRPDAFPKKIDKKKVVIWRPTFNAELPRTWKNFLTNDDWEDIIAAMRQAGLHIVELSYRTPVSEVMYHISTCRMVFCYDGMWHYIAKNFARPLVVVSPEGITTYHTPHALKLSPFEDNKNYYKKWINNIPKLLGESKQRAVKHERDLRGDFIEDLYHAGRTHSKRR